MVTIASGFHAGVTNAENFSQSDRYGNVVKIYTANLRGEHVDHSNYVASYTFSKHGPMATM